MTIPNIVRGLRANRHINPLSILFGFSAEWMQRRNQIGLSAETKPPNIVVLSCKEGNFSRWKTLLESVLSNHMYVIYELAKEDFLRAHWTQNVTLLILDHVTELKETEHRLLDSFINEGGSALIHCSSRKGTSGVTEDDLSKQECIYQDEKQEKLFAGFVSLFLQNKNVSEGSRSLCRIHHQEDSIVTINKCNQGHCAVSALDFIASENNVESSPDNSKNIKILLKQTMESLKLKCSSDGFSDKVKLTPGYLSGKSEDVKMFASSVHVDRKIFPRRGLNLRVIEPGEKFDDLDVSEDDFPIVLRGSDTRGPKWLNFSFVDYWTHLEATKLGRILIYSHTVMSTQIILEKISASSLLSDGVVVVASRQTQGKGRGGNQWLSPEGCMMFSLAVSIKTSSDLGRRLPFLQHIAAVAVVEAVREMPGYEEINVRIKWPNDIYFGSDVKIGGLVVNSSLTDGEFKAVIGIGVNVSNKKPTICLNRIIEGFNAEHDTCLKPLTIEAMIASTLTNIEQLLQVFQVGGFEEFCEMYYKYWLHSDQQIRLGSEKGELVTIKGLDENGFLLVEKNNGDRSSLQPDGNSFDMMRGLLVIKTRH